MIRSDGWILGVDIGGTNVVVGAVPVHGAPPMALRNRATEAEVGPDAVVDRIGAMIVRTMTELEKDLGVGRDQILGVGIGSPGPIDRTTGVVITSPNLGWVNYPLRDRLSELVGLPATLNNDANCATFGEWWLGAGRGASTLVGLTLGTGIGGGIIIDGELYHGASDAAGEVGHMSIDIQGRRCKCGNYGCLEAYASGPNMAARACEGLEAGEESVLWELVDGDLERLSAETLYEAVVLGDPFAAGVMRDTARILGAGIANLINLLNPDVLVIMGGVTRAGEILFGPLRNEIRRRAFRSAADACEVRAAELPETAGVVGAAGLFKKSQFGTI